MIVRAPLHCRRSAASATVITLACTALAGCSSIEGLFGGDKLDYRSQAAKTQPLEVPPDLTQLARDSRYRPQGGVVTASTLATPGGTPVTGAAAAGAPVAAAVAPATVGALRVERQGNQRWLVSTQPPEVLWPQVRAFWQERGFTLEVENAQAGIMETNWAENRAKLPQDFIRRTLGRVLDSLYSTGERDRFRTRIERTSTGSEIYVSHRGMEEIYVAPQNAQTAWQGRPSDPQLEAEFLQRLMVRLGSGDEPARSAIAAAPEAPPRARPAPAGSSAASATAPGTATSVQLDEPFDRAWRRVGLALDRGGFTVEDRDRSAGLYFVRYVDPKTSGNEEPGFLSRLFGGDNRSGAPLRYRVLVKAGEGAAGGTVVSVQNSQGQAETGEIAQRIVSLLVAELR